MLIFFSVDETYGLTSHTPHVQTRSWKNAVAAVYQEIPLTNRENLCTLKGVRAQQKREGKIKK